MRRLKAIWDMEDRPVPITYIARCCGFPEDTIKGIVYGRRPMKDWRWIRLSKFLIELEEGKHGIRKVKSAAKTLGFPIPDGKAPEKTVVCYDVSDKGVKLRFGKINPNKFGHD